LRRQSRRSEHRTSATRPHKWSGGANDDSERWSHNRHRWGDAPQPSQGRRGRGCRRRRGARGYPDGAARAGVASKALGAEVVFEFINANDIQPRITAAIQSGSGPDIIHMLHNWPHLYENGLVEVNELAEWQAKDQGGFYTQSEVYTKVGGRFMALPHSIVPGLIAYRKSWFDEIGVTTFPKTYEELRQVAAKLKKKGKPYGQTLGHTFGDAPAWAYPLMWNFGGAETDKAGKTALDSKGSVEAVKFMTAFWKDACDEGGLAWDDTNNNRAFLGGEISATLNGASIYIAAKRGPDKIKDDKGEPMVRDIQHARLPAGPAGSWSYHTAS
jgi:multiple sugar transport system substrate-binding protein